MTVSTLKKLSAALFCAALLSAPILFARESRADDAKPMTKADVEAIVHDYILSHPGDILTAVQDYQDKSTQAHQAEAVKNNHANLYDAPGTPQAGNPKGDVTLVEFFDYNCGYCKKVGPQISQLIAEDKNLRVVFKDFPILGPSSEVAAKWALAAQKQGKYFEFFQKMMANKSPITDELLEKTAADIGMDVKKAKSDIEGTEALLTIERNRQLASSMDIHGTPAFVIGDELAPGAISIDDMKGLIAKARADKAKAADKPAAKTP